jgi:hypothetical protein
MSIVSALLLWLTADRVLGRRALYDLTRSTRQPVSVHDMVSANDGANGSADCCCAAPALSEQKRAEAASPGDVGRRLFSHNEVADSVMVRPRRRGRAKNRVSQRRCPCQ